MCRYLSISNNEMFTKLKDNIQYLFPNGKISEACLTFIVKTMTTMYCFHSIWEVLN